MSSSTVHNIPLRTPTPIPGTGDRPHVSQNQPRVVLSTACWHTASETYATALHAKGIAFDVAVEGSATYKALNFPGPAFLSVPGRGMVPATLLRDLPMLQPRTEPFSLADASSLAATAVVEDDAHLIGHVWGRLTGGDRTRMLCLAATVGAKTVAEFCVDGMRHNVNRPDPMPARNTPLHYAAMSDQAVIAALLLEFGADPTSLNPVKTQPMHDAARSGAADTLEALYLSGADLTQPNAYGDTMLHRIAEHITAGKQAAFVKLFQLCARDEAERRGQSAVQAFVNRHNSRGITALDMAVARSNDASELAQAMREAGAEHSDVWLNMPAHKRTQENLDHFNEWLDIRDTLSGSAE